jgi:NodT family efflux transporter outer membrane factor (OMF) lipoprotein
LELRSVDAALPAPPPVLQVGLPSELLRRRPDIREAERSLAAANAQIGVQTAKLYPSLDLVGLGSFAGTSAANLFSADNLQSIGVGALMAPLFNGGRSRAAIAEAKEVRAQALFTYEKTVLGAFRDVEDALARLRAEQSRLTELQRSVEASRNSLKIAEDQYSAGLSTFINVLQSETALLERQDQLTQAHAQALSDLASLYKALGGGYRDPATESGSGSSAAGTIPPETSISAAARAARRPEP